MLYRVFELASTMRHNFLNSATNLAHLTNKCCQNFCFAKSCSSKLKCNEQSIHRLRKYLIAFHPARVSSTCASDANQSGDDGPFGDLFRSRTRLGSDMTGKVGCIHRTFGPRDNADAILATGGESLAAHASFDPDYKRAQDWIRQHAVGTAVLSPVLLQGLLGALTEAAFPEGVIQSTSTTHLKALIVGVTVKATIVVQQVEHSTKTVNEQSGEKNGYMVHLKAQVSRVRDDEVILDGFSLIWIPDYENM